MHSPMVKNDMLKRVFRPAFSIRKVAKIVPITLVRPTTAEAAASDYTPAYERIYILIYIHVQVNIYKYTDVHIYVYKYIYIYIYIYITGVNEKLERDYKLPKIKNHLTNK